MTDSHPQVPPQLGSAERLAQRARVEPHALMLADPERVFTVGDVAARAAGVAEVIGEAIGEVLPGQPVLVLADRSPESVIAMLGVMWAGAALVPVDSSDTDARLSTVAAQVGATVAVSPRRTTMRSIDGVRVLDVSAMRPGTCAHRPPAPGTASVIHITSGSSGRPKAVLRTTEQTAVAQERALTDPHQTVGGRSAVFVPPFYAWGFVELVLETCVGRFALMVDIQSDDPDRIAAAIDRWDVERLAVTPSLARLLPSLFGWTRRLAGVRTVFLGGEPVSWPDVSAARSLIAADGVVWVAYGASELLIQTHRFRVGPEMVAGEQPLALGYPLAPECCAVEATGDHPNHGELVVYDLVAEGYLGDPETTAQRFGVDSSGRRFWRTGDIIDVSADGLARHCGRVDDMVKINGKLVEPAEAEAALQSIPGIRAAAVVARTTTSGKQQLIAHVEVDEGVTARSVWDALRRRLPEHVCPSLLVRTERLPVSDRGKLDRQALRRQALRPWRDAAAADPWPLHSGAVVALVARILDVPDLDVDDVLWDVGCDSLAAIEIAAAIVELTGSAIEPNDLITASTVRELCHRLATAGSRRSSHVVEFHPNGTKPPIFVVAGAGGPAFIMRTVIDELGEDQPVILYEQRGLHQDLEPDRTMRDMARRYLADLRRRQPRGPYLLVGRSFGGLVAHEMARRLRRRRERVTLVILDTFRNPNPEAPTSRRLARPPALRTRNSSWPVHVAKLATWRAAVARRKAREYVAGIRRRTALARTDPWAPIGSTERYEQFAAICFDIAYRDRRPVLKAPIWLVHPAGSASVAQWADHRHLVGVEVGGDHVTMVVPPNAAAVATAIRDAAASP